MRRIAFNSRVARQTTGTTGTFVGEGSPTPVKALGFDNITIPWAKASTISAFSVELERLAEPAIGELMGHLPEEHLSPLRAALANYDFRGAEAVVRTVVHHYQIEVRR